MDYDNYNGNCDMNNIYRKPYNSLFVSNFYQNNLGISISNTYNKVLDKIQENNIHDVQEKKIKLSINNMINDKVFYNSSRYIH